MFYAVLYGCMFYYTRLPSTLKTTEFPTTLHSESLQTLDITDGTDFAEMLEKR